ncbi:MAG TPA: hypothetical protein DDZ80_13445 [Cyanobacteria bacterium UBA8803]|nr:hypothetical protein [Cyanobacteria bacterium UBA9273]HBL59475.1 hypothetical protein [Cyanobacteria bacterium UBA8803]
MLQPNPLETQPAKPRLPIPPPLMMSEAGSFANLTLCQRWPTILQRVMAENDFPPSINQNLETLSQELPDGMVRSLHDDTGPDLAAWASYIAPYQGQRWIDVPWFFAEVYLYRRILEATHYFLPGQWQGVDPFAPQKWDSLAKVMPSIPAMIYQINQFINSRGNATNAIALLYFALWGNRVDLSLFPTDAQEQERTRIETSEEQAHILVDDTSTIADRIISFKRVQIDFIIDNAGFELLCDLCLADFLLTTEAADQIYFHLKPHPLFVSDAMIQDVLYTVEVLVADSDRELQLLGHRLQDHIKQSRLICCDDFFWTSPLPFWEMPEQLRTNLAQSQLIFSKGDANYRRLLGDCEWPFTTPFTDIVSYFPAPLAALRTLKAELAAGLQPQQVNTLNQKDPHWLTNGQWGVIQFVDT